jgi:hypothetical protein
VAAPPQTLEALVRDELRGRVSELVERVVRELVREQLNGSGPGPSAQTAVSGPENVQETANGSTPARTKRCSRCRMEKPLDALATGRTTCRKCRAHDERRRTSERHARARQASPPAAGVE